VTFAHRLFLVASAIAIVVSQLNSLPGSEVVCRKAAVGGYDSEHDAAYRILSGTTTDLWNCEIYITRRGTDIYAHSNYRSVISDETSSETHKSAGEGHEGFVVDLPDALKIERRWSLSFGGSGKHHDYPTKMVAPETKLRSLDDITNNVVADGAEFLERMSGEIKRASKHHIKYLLDPSMFDSDGTLAINIGSAGNLYLADPNVPPPKRLHPTRSSRGPPWMADIGFGLLMKVRSRFMPDEVIKRLQSTRVRKNRFKLIFLINDLSTEAALGQTQLASHVAKLSTLTEDSIRDVFRRNSRSVIAVLGHAENGNFVVKDASGERILLDFPMDRLANFADEFECQLINLGCSAGRESGGIGAADPFNPIHAVQRLAAALNVGDYRAFFETLAGPELRVVFDDTAFSQAAANEAGELRFEIFPSADTRVSAGFIAGAIRLPPSTFPPWLFVVIFFLTIGVSILVLAVRPTKNGRKRPAD
jgi:hypothetical protein